MGNQIIQRTGLAKTKAVADVVFCFDCTGSMASCIDHVKEYANAFVTGLNADQNTVIDWRMRAVGYGDLEIGEQMQLGNEFVSTVPEFQAQLAGIKMCYGGDADESTLDAIVTTALTTKWRKAHKIIVVFTDAKTKPLHPSTKTTFAVNGMEDLKARLAEAHIKLFLWGPADPNYKELMALPQAEITELADPKQDYLNENKMEKLLELMGKTVSATTGSEVL